MEQVFHTKHTALRMKISNSHSCNFQKVLSEEQLLKVLFSYNIILTFRKKEKENNQNTVTRQFIRRK